MSGPLLAFFAHPDDETFTAAGVMTAAAERGIPVTVVTATRGEAGGSGIPGLNDPERLGIVRERELREAMRQIGVTDVRWLGYRDSGLEEDTAPHPLAFVRVPVETAAAELATYIRSLRPQVMLTFGPEGLYGHPDHVHAYRVARRAIEMAADSQYKDSRRTEPWQTPALYFVAFPREEMQAMLAQPGGHFDWLTPEARANLGTPRADITHTVDTSPWATRKRAAIAAHQTQTGAGGPLSDIPVADIEARLRREYFVRVPLPWSSETDTDDIIATLAEEQAAV
jgi:N-acetyl-1-D-myo-inositol-2-amino-2-deoxy-alpha-D-glucopyranoside deacetylase